MKKLTLLTAIFLLIPFQVKAQDNAPTESYTPPPMFGAPRPVPPKKIAPATPKLPKISVPASDMPSDTPSTRTETNTQQNKPKKTKTPPPAKRQAPTKQKQIKKNDAQPPKAPVIPPKKPEHPKDQFEGTPIGQVPENGTVERNEVKPGIEPIDLIRKQSQPIEPVPLKPATVVPSTPTPITAPDPTFKGVVKGPKTMPSVKKQSVDTEVLFEPESTPPAPIINRINIEETPKDQSNESATAVTLNESYTLPTLRTDSDGNRKLNLVFEETQDKLTPEQLHTLSQLIIPALQQDTNTRLLLEAFASPQDDSLSGDRRLALTRAMAIRSHILAQEDIAPNRLSVRSLGSQTDIQPMDRVEILLVQ